jgi:Ala-tRNA(Pro) deacylase
MTALNRCREYLEMNGVAYAHSIHSPAYTAREVAAAAHMPARNLAKTVIYFGDNGYGMLLIPADCVIDLPEVLRLLGLSQIRLATEAEMAKIFPDSEIGAMPPVPTEMPVLVDTELADSEFIVFNAGTHRDLIGMSFEDFRRLVNPLVASFAIREPAVPGGRHAW